MNFHMSVVDLKDWIVRGGFLRFPWFPAKAVETAETAETAENMIYMTYNKTYMIYISYIACGFHFARYRADGLGADAQHIGYLAP